MSTPPMDGSGTRKVLKWLWKNYARNAKKRQFPVPWLLSLVDFMELTSHDCIYCGKPPSNRRRDVLYQGIDRKNNREGYSKPNCVPCCKQCNSIKGEHLSFEEMRTAMEAVSRHRRQAGGS